MAQKRWDYVGAILSGMNVMVSVTWLVNVDGKTNKRTAIARDRVENSLWRQAQLNPRIRQGL